MLDTEQVAIEVRDSVGVWRWLDSDDWDAATLVAALSSDPRTLRELALSWARYRSNEPLVSYLQSVPQSVSPVTENSKSQALEGVWLVIDLEHHLCWTNDDSLFPSLTGCLAKGDDEVPFSEPKSMVWLNLPPHWEMAQGVAWDWGHRDSKIPHEPIDVRGVLYGRTMAQFFADRIVRAGQRADFPRFVLDWSHFADRSCADADCLDSPQVAPHEMQWVQSQSKEIHASWLTTRQHSLGNEIPRHWLHAGREWVDREIENRQQEWSTQLTMPRPLDRDTYTYCYGPFSTTEVIVYFELCRACVHYGWIRIQDDPQMSCADLANAIFDFSRNYMLRDSTDSNLPSAGELIELSRRHMPIQSEPDELDCDCPICQKMMEHPEWFGPSFLQLSGQQLEMESEFAFSLCTTREEWQAWGFDED